MFNHTQQNHKRWFRRSFRTVPKLLLIPVLLIFQIFNLLNPKHTLAQSPYSLLFDAHNDTVTVTKSASLDITGALTLEAWIKPVANPTSSYGQIVGINTYGGRVADMYCLTLNSNNTISFGVTDNEAVYTATGATAVTNNEWIHVAGVFTPSESLEVFVNGNSDGINTANIPSSIQSVEVDLTIGNLTNPSAAQPLHFPGYIDEVRVWNISRTQIQIQNNLIVEVETASGLQGRWGFAEGSDTFVSDSSGNNNNGTASGTTWENGYSFPDSLTVYTNAATSVGNTGATLNANLANLAGEGSVDGYFKWGTDPGDLDNTTSTQALSSTGTFTATLTDLTEDRTYFFQAYVENGSTASGEILSSRTLGGLYNLSFNGSSDYLSALASPTSQYTIEMWIKSDGTQTQATPPSLWSWDQTGGAHDYDFRIYLDGDDKIVALWDTGTSVDRGAYVKSSTTVTHNTWQHIAFTQASNTAKIYLNGHEVGSETIPAHLTGAVDAVIGRSYISGYVLEHFFSGDIDEVRYWNYAHTQQQIRDNMNTEIESATGLIGRWGLNDGAGSVALDNGTGDNDATVNGATWVEGNFSKPNISPWQPTLNSPVSGATVTNGTSTTLSISVDDFEGTDLTVKFYGRRKTSSGDNFTIIALPDTQYYSETYPDTFTAQTQWIVDNKTSENIVFVTHEGDIVENGDTNETEWQRANTSMGLLDDIVSYGLTPGNHDLPYSFYDQYFPASRYSGESWYGGNYSNNRNSYQLFSAGADDYLILHLEYCPSDSIVSWADGVLKAYPDRQAIITTHLYLNTNNTRDSTSCGDDNNGQELWDNLITQNDNAYFVLSGHWHGGDGGARLSSTTNGRTVHQIMANYQHLSNGGDGYLRKMQFQPNNDLVVVDTYSPTLGTYLLRNDNNFELEFSMTGNQNNWELLSTETASSGSIVNFVWGSLSPYSDYEWYATVSDGNGTTIGPIWSFTTSFDLAETGEAFFYLKVLGGFLFVYPLPLFLKFDKKRRRRKKS